MKRLFVSFIALALVLSCGKQDRQPQDQAPVVSVSGLSLDRQQLSLKSAGSFQLNATILPANATDREIIWTSVNPEIAKVSASGMVSTQTAGRTLVVATTRDGSYADTCKVHVWQEPVFIDLGLSIKWADRNLGADSPSDKGEWYAWAEIQPKKYYTWRTYQYSKGDDRSLTKYCDDPEKGYQGYTDEFARLESEDDAARQAISPRWRIPSSTDWQELVNKCDWTYATVDGQNGFKVAKHLTPSVYIFIPFSGSAAIPESNSGNYWTSERNSGYPDQAHYFEMRMLEGSTPAHYTTSTSRCFGFNIRPVYQ